MTSLMNKAGFANTKFKPLTFGIAVIYSGERADLKI
jgi:ubiquinone/menaquinone biosynthesis C-methylase UbiE